VFFKTLAKIIHFTEDSGDIQVRYDIVHIAEAFSSSNLVSAFSFTFVYPIELTLYWSCYPYGAFLLSRLTDQCHHPQKVKGVLPVVIHFPLR